MPILQNAKKALRQAKKREATNKIVKKVYKDALKSARKAVATGEKDLTEKIRLAQKTLGKAVKKGILKKNAASRYLSRLSKKVATPKIENKTIKEKIIKKVAKK